MTGATGMVAAARRGYRQQQVFTRQHPDVVAWWVIARAVASGWFIFVMFTAARYSLPVVVAGTVAAVVLVLAGGYWWSWRPARARHREGGGVAQSD